MKEDELCARFLLIYVALLLFVSILPFFHFSSKDESYIDALDWSQGLINDIEVVGLQNNCSPGYESLINYEWSGLKGGCFCADSKYYDVSLCKSQIKKQYCLDLPEIKPKILRNFAFIKADSNIKLQIPFKTCGKKISSYISKTNKQLNDFCISSQAERCVIDNYAFCMGDNAKCPQFQQTCQKTEKKCQINNKLIFCLQKNERCPSLFECESRSDKPCFLQDKIICVNSSEKCPITGISFVNYKQKSNTPLNQDQEVKQIQVNADYNLIIDRNKKGIPIIDFTLSSIDGVCLEDQRNILVKNYPMDKRNVCLKSDFRYISVFEFSIISTDLYKFNEIEIGNHAGLIPDYDQFEMYFRRYYDSSYQCQYQVDTDSLKNSFESIVSLSQAMFYLSLIGIITYAVSIYYHVNNDKKQILMIASFVLIFIDACLFLFILTNSSDIKKATKDFQNEKCYNSDLIGSVNNLNNYLEGGIVLFTSIVYLPIYIFVQLFA